MKIFLGAVLALTPLALANSNKPQYKQSPLPAPPQPAQLGPRHTVLIQTK